MYDKFVPPFSRRRSVRQVKPEPSLWDAFPKTKPPLSDAEIAAQRDGSLANLARNGKTPPATFIPGAGIVPSTALLDRWNGEAEGPTREPMTAAEREEAGIE